MQGAKIKSFGIIERGNTSVVIQLLVLNARVRLPWKVALRFKMAQVF